MQSPQPSLDHLFGTKAAFPSFLSRTNQKANIATTIGNMLSHLDPAELPKNLILLDVGCGEGDLSSRVFADLFKHAPDLNYIGVDSQQVMLVSFNEKLRRRDIQGGHHQTIYGRFFDRPTFSAGQFDAIPMDNTTAANNARDALRAQQPELFAAIEFAKIKGKVGIILCSHTLYYTEDMGQAHQDCAEMLSPEGFSIFVHQSANSQMHQLRSEFSRSTATIRQPDGQPNCSDHMVAASRTGIPIIEYSSDLFFPENYKKEFALLRQLLAAKTPTAQWSEAATSQGLDADSFATTCGVLQFILRQELLTADSATVSAFLGKTEQLLDTNPKLDGKPRLFIRESIVFSASNERTISHLQQVVAGFKEEQASALIAMGLGAKALQL